VSDARAPIRPLILLPSDPFGEKIGGIKTFVTDFVRYAPDDFAPELIGCSSDPVDRPVGTWQERLIGGRPVRYLPVLATPDVHRRPLVPLSLQFTAAAILRRSARHYAGRILQFHHPGVPAGFLSVRAPKILVAHLNVADIDRGSGESRWSRIPGLLHRFEDVTLPRIDRIFVVNQEGVAFYRQRHPRIADRVAFLPTSVDQAMFRPMADPDRDLARRRLLDQLGLVPSADVRLALFVGRLERQKNPLLLIDGIARAMAAASAARNLRLVVIGEGSLRAGAEARARDLGVADRIHWLGFQPREDLPSIMNAADLLVLPSAFEGMPITVLEALACGLPVVATDVGGVGLVVHDRVNGRLTGHAPEEIAEAIGWVLDRPRDAFEAAAREAVAPYQPEAVLRPFFDAHRELHDRAMQAARRD
jgi:glycosyltransferase involved in cell wall biosynthesis